MPEIDAVEVVDVEDGADAALAALPGVESVTRPGTLATQQAVVPNDGAYHAQWWPDLIDLPEAWARRSSSGGVRIALVDTGIDATWPDLAGRVDTGFDVRYNVTLPAGRSSDRDPHGTAMAGFIGAAGNNLHGIAGADWGAVLVPYRVIDVNQCIFETTVAEAILQASEDPSIRIIVIALGTPVEATILRDAVDVAQERGKLVISAVGNYGGEDDPVVYPAAYPGVVAVGATTRANERASYSSTGRHLDVVAPGGSGVRDPSGLYSQGENLLALWEQGKLRPVVGTSFAAAHVAGAAALYFGEYPHARPDDVRLALQASARDLGQFGHDRTTGYGLLDVARLLATPPPGGPVPDPATGQLPRVNHRLPNELAEAASGQRFADGAAAHAVLARGDVFVDALAGAPLTADGPLLLTSDGTLPASTLEELERVLGGPGRVYVLGGTTAVSPGVVATLEARGHEVVRLAGDTRITTAHAVAEEVRGLYGPGDTVALARADSWADAVTGGAWAAAQRIPVRVTGSDALDPTVAAALADWGVQRTVLLGGTTALSAAVAAAVPGPDRVEGPERAAAAVAVAERLWGGDPDGWIVVNGWVDDGWAAALAAAGLAADDGDPVLMTNRSDLPPATRAAVAASCDAAPTVRLVGDDSYIGGSVESELAEVARCAR